LAASIFVKAPSLRRERGGQAMRLPGRVGTFRKPLH
jgi:hypothetical protein